MRRGTPQTGRRDRSARLSGIRASVEHLLFKATSLVPGLSRSLSGTDASLGAIVKGRLALRRNRRHRRVITPSAQIHNVSTFERTGLLDLGQPFESGLVDRIHDTFDKYIVDDARCFLRYTSSPDIHEERTRAAVSLAPVIHRRLLEPHALIPEIEGVLTESLMQLIEGVYGCHARLTSVNCWRNYHLPLDEAERREFGYSHYWHNDRVPIDTLKLFVALSDIDEQDGPLYLIPKDVSRRIVNRSFHRKESRHAPRLNAAAVRMTGPRGTAVLCDSTRCLHRAGIPAAGRQRDMLQLVFRSSASRDIRLTSL